MIDTVIKEVAKNSERFDHWKIVDGQLYYLRPKLIISKIVEDFDCWKLVLPKELRNEALRESHDIPQVGQLGIDKTYQRLAVPYFWPKCSVMLPNMFEPVKRVSVPK